MADSFEDFLVSTLGMPEPSDDVDIVQGRDHRDVQQALLATLGNDVESTPGGDSPNVLEGILKTAAFDATLGLVGIKPPESVEQFKVEHPFLGLASTFVGLAAPYGLAARFGPLVASKTPVLKRALTFARESSRAREAPFASGAIEAAAGFAPFQAARLVGAATLGDEGAVGKVAKEIAFETPFIAGLGGVGRAVSRGRPFPGRELGDEGQVARTFAEYEIFESPQRRLETVNKILKNNRAKILDEKGEFNDLGQALLQVRNRLSEEIIEEVPAAGRAWVQTTNQKLTPAAGLSRLFRGKRASKLPNPNESRASKDRFEGIMRVLAPGTEPGVAEAEMKFPRLLEATDGAGETLWRNILKGFGANQVGVGRSQSFLAQEANGVYVMAKRIAGRQGTPGKPGSWAGPHRFVIFKTTNPGLFEPKANRFAKLPVKNSFWENDVMALEQELRGLSDARWLQNHLKLSQGPGLGGVVSRQMSDSVQRAMGPELAGLTKNLAVAAGGTKDYLKTFLSPALFEGSRDPEFINLLTAARMMHSRGAARASTLFFGKSLPPKAQSIFKQILGETEKVGGLERLVNRLSQKDIVHLRIASNEGLTISQVQSQLGASKEVVGLMRRLKGIQSQYLDKFARLKKVTGEEIFSPADHHFMLPRAWEGHWRVPIYRRASTGEFQTKPVAFASGFSKKEVLKEADDLIKEVKAAGIEGNFGFFKTRFQSFGRDRDLQLVKELDLNRSEVKAFISAKSRLIEKAGARQATTFKVSQQRDDLSKSLFSGLIESERTLQDRVTRHFLDPHVKKLAQREPALGDQLSKRLAAMAGEKGDVSRRIDEILDPLLASFAGRNAASNIVRTANQAMFHWTLGFGDLGFAAVNALTPVITVLPETAYLLHAPPQALARYYSHSLVANTTGRLESVRALDPVRILNRALRSMGSPDDELRSAFRWAEEFGHIDPKYVEEFVGQNARTVKNWRSILSSQGGFLEFGKELSKFLPGVSEKFTRGVSFATGYHVGKDFFGLSGERLWDFAAQFTARTNFLYSVGDRPRIITGSVGTLFGLFKNWGMHQVGNMMVYAGEGVARRNWSPLMWMMGGTAAMGGLGALPFYGAADSFSKLVSDDPITENLYEAMGLVGTPDAVEDSVMYGLPAFLGISLQGRVAPTGNQIVRDVDFLFRSATLDRMGALTDALGQSISHWRNTGQNPLYNERQRLMWYRALLPRTLYRAMSFTEEKGLQSLRTGNSLTDPASLPQRASFFFGLTPLEFEKTLDLQNELWADQTKRKAMISSYGAAWAEATKRGDAQELIFLMKRAIEDGVSPDSILRSADGFTRKAEGAQIDRQFDAYQVLRRREILGLD